MASPDSTLSALSAIQQKVRLLTRSPDENLLPTSTLNNYINNAILYNFPSNIRLFSYRTVLTFYTQPFVDTYATSNDPNNALYNFTNQYIAIHPPAYLAGIQGFFTQWRDIFYGYWPQTNTIADTNLRGDGLQTTFSGVVFASPMLQNHVNFNALDANGNSIVLVDTPSSNPTIGALGIQQNGPTAFPSIYGFINYVTGAFTVNFAAPLNPPAAGTTIWVENIAYQPGKPLSMLFYNDTFTIRPVPDKTYAIQVEADVRPTVLLQASDVPSKGEYWQYIAYLAAKLVFEDRMDLESVQQIMPELRRQECMVLRTSIMQQANDRTITPYTQGKNYGFGWFGPGGWPY